MSPLHVECAVGEARRLSEEASEDNPLQDDVSLEATLEVSGELYVAGRD